MSETIVKQSAVSSAAAVAADIRRRMPDADDALVHKLLYFVQGTHLQWERRPAFEQDLEAWPQGPVVACLWHAEADGHAARHGSRYRSPFTTSSPTCWPTSATVAAPSSSTTSPSPIPGTKSPTAVATSLASRSPSSA